MATRTSNSEKAEQKARALESLKNMLKPGDEVYTICKHVSRSGMMRHIAVYIARDGKIIDISWYVSHAIGWSRADNGGIKVSGAGMDMGFHLVYTLGRVMFHEGFKLEKGQYGRNGDTSGFDKDGGYAFTQRWL